jgi:catechol 2,3-dioxygenase-like lactoylglutathione lyase family enzyme
MTLPAPPLNQIAFSVIDLRRTERIQGLPAAASTCWWLVGRNPWFQREMFQFERPMARPLPLDFRPCDIGYTRIGLWVEDFDATLRRLDAIGTRPLAAPVGAHGARRACVRSPDGVHVELMEDDPLGASVAAGRAEYPVAVRSVTLSVPDLGRSVALFRGLGLETWSGALHTPEHEAAWGLRNARLRSQALLAGDVLVEIAQYLDPPGKPWPNGYRITDQGILNVAFGARSKVEHTRIYEHALAVGARPNCNPVHLPGAGVVYVNDADGFSVEILWMKPGTSDRDWGFEPRPIDRRPRPDTHAVEASIHFDASVEHTWRIVTDHEAMAAWSGFRPVTVTTPGQDGRNGYGSQRTMQGPTGSVVEEVVGWEPPHSCRYRVVQGAPFLAHHGELQLAESNGGTELTFGA